MSLSNLIKEKDVAARIKLLRLAPYKQAMPLRVTPQTSNYGLVGTAFDYVVRFEIVRRAPHAIARSWIAEDAMDRIWHQDPDGVSMGFELLGNADPSVYQSPEQIADRGRAIIESAKRYVATYVKRQAPSRDDQFRLAEHAIRLAKLDVILRAFFLAFNPDFLEQSFDSPDVHDVQDVVAMLEIVPFDDLLHDSVLLLNPTFGDASRAVGGADADLISGSRLIDFKASKKGELKTSDRDQLLGYFLLARRHRRDNPAFPTIDTVGVYFARHGEMWLSSTDEWTNSPAFVETEFWFFDRARQLGFDATNIQ
jgi:hypothetical protein